MFYSSLICLFCAVTRFPLVYCIPVGGAAPLQLVDVAGAPTDDVSCQTFSRSIAKSYLLNIRGLQAELNFAVRPCVSATLRFSKREAARRIAQVKVRVS